MAARPLFHWASVCRAKMARRNPAGRELDSARQCPRLFEPDSLHGRLRCGCAALRHGRALKLRLAASRLTGHEAVAGVGRRADLRDDWRPQSRTRDRRGGTRILISTLPFARAALSLLAKKRSDSERASGNAGKRESIRQRARQFHSRDAARL